MWYTLGYCSFLHPESLITSFKSYACLDIHSLVPEFRENY